MSLVKLKRMADPYQHNFFSKTKLKNLKVFIQLFQVKLILLKVLDRFSIVLLRVIEKYSVIKINFNLEASNSCFCYKY